MEISFADDPRNLLLTGFGRLGQQRNPVSHHVVVIVLPELDLQQVKRNDRFVSRIVRDRRELPLGRLQIAAGIVDISDVIRGVRLILRIGIAVLEIAVGLVGVPAHVGGISRPEIIFVETRKVELIGIDLLVLRIGGLVIALLVQQRAERKPDVVRIDRTRILQNETVEHLAGVSLPHLGGAQSYVISRPLRKPDIVGTCAAGRLLELGLRSGVFLFFVKGYTLIVMGLRLARRGFYLRNRSRQQQQRGPETQHFFSHIGSCYQLGKVNKIYQ